MKLAELLAQHAKEIGVPLRLDAHGICHLVINSTHHVTLETGDHDSFFLYAQVLRLPETGNEGIYKAILYANLYGKRTQGVVFALDTHGTQVILFVELREQLTDYVVYQQTMQKFINQLAFWKDELAGMLSLPAPSEEGGELTDDTGQWIKL